MAARGLASGNNIRAARRHRDCHATPPQLLNHPTRISWRADRATGRSSPPCVAPRRGSCRLSQRGGSARPRHRTNRSSGLSSRRRGSHPRSQQPSSAPGIDVPWVCDQRLTPETPAECVKAAEQAMLSLGGLGLRAVRVSSLGHGSAGREPRRKAAKAGASDLSSSAPAI
jgi:hypothetical protein